LKNLNFVAVCSFGIEGILKNELKNLGYKINAVENGKVFYSGEELDIARANINLRTADRVYLQLDRFDARDFDDIYDNINSINWGKYIPEDGRIVVNASTKKSVLQSERSLQSVGKKAVIDSLTRAYNKKEFPETGEDCNINIDINKNRALLLFDTTGDGLNKRGYRIEAGQAPIKETLAASLIYISGWNPQFYLVDPFCGSGTIVIEAAMVANNIPPGLYRDFASKNWNFIDQRIWDRAEREAKKEIENKDLRIIGSDYNHKMIEISRKNAKRAGVNRFINFKKRDIKNFEYPDEKGFIVTNPPYGERMKEEKIERLYKTMGEQFRNKPGWAQYIITSYEDFRHAYGKKEDKNRKLYNGNIQCYLYQYYYKRKRNR